MSKESDPSLYGSNFERNPADRYWTEHWITRALLLAYPIRLPEVILDPAAGRGDIVGVLKSHDLKVAAADIDASEWGQGGSLGDLTGMVCWENDFLTAEVGTAVRSIVTNPPYTLADKFVRRALHEMEHGKVEMSAFLLRSEWKHAGKRADLFGVNWYAGEVVLQNRPRWDWWFREKPVAAPRHNYSWFIWDRVNSSAPVQRFVSKAIANKLGSY